MISAPFTAIYDAKNHDELALVMSDIFAGVYTMKGGGAYTAADFSVWACKYKSLAVAKKCAIKWYFRVKETNHV